MPGLFYSNSSLTSFRNFPLNFEGLVVVNSLFSFFRSHRKKAKNSGANSDVMSPGNRWQGICYRAHLVSFCILADGELTQEM